MNRQIKKIAALSLLSIFVSPFTEGNAQEKKIKDLPNILWIVSEDNSAYFTGCYGNSFATTPNIDKLASEGFTYTHAYAAHAVCAPTRNSILTGVYACSNGNENMRSTYAKSDIVRTYPEYLREAGYYCTNNSKTDYNTNSVDPNAIWDESSDKAHYKNAPDGKPFFAVFNSMISHESCLFMRGLIPDDKLKHDPAKVVLPPYSPDIPEMRHDWAQYYDYVEKMDVWVGKLLKELDDSGLADNTIVMYYGDHGGVLPRSKRFLYETGTQAPLVIRIPKKYEYLYPNQKNGTKVDRLVNFVDFVPTLLSIAGVPVPDYMQGNAFLGAQKTKDPEYTFMARQRMDERVDNVRAVRDNQYRYIRNYMPFRITMQHVKFLFLAQSAQAWEDAFYAGETNEVQSRFFMEKPVEELYDTENDPWEVNNLAKDPKYAGVLKRMRKALDDWRLDIYDTGVIPETEYKTLAGEQSLYDYVRSTKCPFKELIKASDLAVMGNSNDVGTYVNYLKNENSAIRYWGAVGLLMLKEDAVSAIPELIEAANDKSAAVATIAAEGLYRIGEKKAAIQAYKRLLDSDAFDMTSRNFTVNSLDAIDANTPEIVTAVKKMKNELESSFKPTKSPEEIKNLPAFFREQELHYNEYDMAVMENMLKRWGED